jgi:hypothetical protein
MKQLDAGTGYRTRIEQDLSKRLGDTAAGKGAQPVNSCPKCSTANDPDARFCKSCGERLA